MPRGGEGVILGDRRVYWGFACATRGDGGGRWNEGTDDRPARVKFRVFFCGNKRL